ncbi:MAG: glutamate--tRNA ligase [bacterium]|nr:glutamate--tRNA ligase [bacterium]
MSQEVSVRTRFAPSPTGFLHIGGLRTALYSYAFAKSQNGQFVLRIEDTDRKRFVPGSTEKIYELLKLFGLNWDEGPLVGGPYEPYIQSERAKEGIYKKYAEKLVEQDKAYYCFHTEEVSEKDDDDLSQKKLKLRDECRNLSKLEVEEKLEKGEKAAIRVKIPDDQKVTYHDFIIKKDISWETKFIDDVVLLKSDGFPTYHLGVVVDDVLMEITHILRGHDWLPSTPVHLLLMDFLGFKRPGIGHLTDILDPEGGKLSKRKGSVSCEEFLTEGYLPEAILNFIMLLGWAPKDNRELFTLEEFVENFPKGNLQVANPVFDRKKLDWFNGIYLRKKTDEELFHLIEPFAPKNANSSLIKKTIPLVKERITKLSDYSSFASFFFKGPEVDGTLLNENAITQLQSALSVLEELDKWDKEKIEKALLELISSNKWKTGDFFMNFRIAITGSRNTPPITDSIVLLGREKTLLRLKRTLEEL